MKIILLAAALATLPTPTHAQSLPDQTLLERVQRLEDRVALGTLVDTVASLADQNDAKGAISHFAEDAEAENYSNGKLIQAHKGRRNIEATYTAHIAEYDRGYRMSGQQTFDLHGDNATGVSYSFVLLSRMVGGRRIKSTLGVIYKDTFVRRDNIWMIAKRQSFYQWQDKAAMQEIVRSFHLANPPKKPVKARRR